MATDIRDFSRITDEDLLRRMWQETDDFSRKKEIRAHMYKIREQRLKDFYNSGDVLRDVQRSNSSPGIRGKQQLDGSMHTDTLTDHSFMSLKSKEVRDSESPTRDVSYSNIRGTGDNAWTVVKSSDRSADGRSKTSSQIATTGGVRKTDDGVGVFGARDEQHTYQRNEGDDNNYVRTSGDSKHLCAEERFVGGDDNNFHSSFKKTVTSSSQMKQKYASSTAGDDPIEISEVRSNYGDDTDIKKKSESYVTTETCRHKLQDDNVNKYENSKNIHQDNKDYTDSSVRQRQNVRNETQSSTTRYITESPRSDKPADTSDGIVTSKTVKIYKYGDPNLPDYAKHNIVGGVTKVVTETKTLSDGSTVTKTRYETTGPSQDPNTTNTSRVTNTSQIRTDNKRTDYNVKDTYVDNKKTDYEQRNVRTDNRRTDDLKDDQNIIRSSIKVIRTNEIYDDASRRHPHDDKPSKPYEESPSKMYDVHDTKTEDIHNIRRTVKKDFDVHTDSNDVKNRKNVDIIRSTTEHFITTERVPDEINQPYDDFISPQNKSQPHSREPSYPNSRESSAPVSRESSQPISRDTPQPDSRESSPVKKYLEKSPSPDDVKHSSQKKTTVIKEDCKVDYTTTYRQEFTNKRISVELSPSHDAFAKTLRSSSPDRSISSRPSSTTRSLRNSTNSIRSSTSPEKVRSDHPEDKLPTRKISNTTTRTEVTRRRDTSEPHRHSPERKLPIGERKTPNADRKTPYSSTSREPSPKKTPTRDITSPLKYSPTKDSPRTTTYRDDFSRPSPASRDSSPKKSQPFPNSRESSPKKSQPFNDTCDIPNRKNKVDKTSPTREPSNRASPDKMVPKTFSTNTITKKKTDVTLTSTEECTNNRQLKGMVPVEPTVKPSHDTKSPERRAPLSKTSNFDILDDTTTVITKKTVTNYDSNDFTHKRPDKHSPSRKSPTKSDIETQKPNDLVEKYPQRKGSTLENPDKETPNQTNIDVTSKKTKITEYNSDTFTRKKIDKTQKTLITDDKEFYNVYDDKSDSHPSKNKPTERSPSKEPSPRPGEKSKPEMLKKKSTGILKPSEKDLPKSPSKSPQREVTRYPETSHSRDTSPTSIASEIEYIKNNNSHIVTDLDSEDITLIVEKDIQTSTRETRKILEKKIPDDDTYEKRPTTLDLDESPKHISKDTVTPKTKSPEKKAPERKSPGKQIPTTVKQTQELISPDERPPSTFIISPEDEEPILYQSPDNKKTKKTESGPQSKPESLPINKELKERPPLRRTDTYEERCREILGLANKTKTDVQKIVGKDVPTTKLTETTHKVVKKDEPDKLITRKSPEKVSEGYIPSEKNITSPVKKYPEEICTSITVTKKIVDQEFDETSVITNEYGKPIKKSPQDDTSRSLSREQSPEKIDKLKTKPKGSQITEFPSQRRSPESSPERKYPQTKESPTKTIIKTTTEESSVNKFSPERKPSKTQEKEYPLKPIKSLDKPISIDKKTTMKQTPTDKSQIPQETLRPNTTNICTETVTTKRTQKIKTPKTDKPQDETSEDSDISIDNEDITATDYDKTKKSTSIITTELINIEKMNTDIKKTHDVHKNIDNKPTHPIKKQPCDRDTSPDEPNEVCNINTVTKTTVVKRVNKDIVTDQDKTKKTFTEPSETYPRKEPQYKDKPTGDNILSRDTIIIDDVLDITSKNKTKLVVDQEINETFINQEQISIKNQNEPKKKIEEKQPGVKQIPLVKDNIVTSKYSPSKKYPEKSKEPSDEVCSITEDVTISESTTIKSKPISDKVIPLKTDATVTKRKTSPEKEIPSKPKDSYIPKDNEAKYDYVITEKVTDESISKIINREESPDKTQKYPQDASLVPKDTFEKVSPSKVPAKKYPTSDKKEPDNENTYKKYPSSHDVSPTESDDLRCTTGITVTTIKTIKNHEIDEIVAPTNEPKKTIEKYPQNHESIHLPSEYSPVKKMTDKKPNQKESTVKITDEYLRTREGIPRKLFDDENTTVVHKTIVTTETDVDDRVINKTHIRDNKTSREKSPEKNKLPRDILPKSNTSPSKEQLKNLQSQNSAPDTSPDRKPKTNLIKQTSKKRVISDHDDSTDFIKNEQYETVTTTVIRNTKESKIDRKPKEDSPERKSPLKSTPIEQVGYKCIIDGEEIKDKINTYPGRSSSSSPDQKSPRKIVETTVTKTISSNKPSSKYPGDNTSPVRDINKKIPVKTDDSPIRKQPVQTSSLPKSIKKPTEQNSKSVFPDTDRKTTRTPTKQVYRKDLINDTQYDQNNEIVIITTKPAITTKTTKTIKTTVRTNVSEPKKHIVSTSISLSPVEPISRKPIGQTVSKPISNRPNLPRRHTEEGMLPTKPKTTPKSATRATFTSLKSTKVTKPTTIVKKIKPENEQNESDIEDDLPRDILTNGIIKNKQITQHTKQLVSNRIISDKTLHTITNQTKTNKIPLKDKPKPVQEVQSDLNSKIVTTKTVTTKTRTVTDGKMSPSKLPAGKKKPDLKISTKTITLTAQRNEVHDDEEVIIDIQQSKSSREPSPDHIFAMPAEPHEDKGRPRHPDLITEPDDHFQRKKPTKLTDTPIEENEDITDFIERKITEISTEEYPGQVSRTTYITDVDKVQETDDSLLSVTEKVSKFSHTIDEKVKPKNLNEPVAPKVRRPDFVIEDEELKTDECLLSVSEKVNKFLSTTEQLTTSVETTERPKSPRLRDYDDEQYEIDEELQRDECLLSVTDKVNKFIKTAEQVSVPRKTGSGPAPKVARPDITDVDETLKTDECLLSVSDKVNKFLTTAEKLTTTNTRNTVEELTQYTTRRESPTRSRESSSREPSIEKKSPLKAREPSTEKKIPIRTREPSSDKESPDRRVEPKRQSPVRKPVKNTEIIIEKGQTDKSEIYKKDTSPSETPKSTEAVRKAKALFENLSQTQETSVKKELFKPTKTNKDVKLTDIGVFKKTIKKEESPEPKSKPKYEKTTSSERKYINDDDEMQICSDEYINKRKVTNLTSDNKDTTLKSTRLLLNKAREVFEPSKPTKVNKDEPRSPVKEEPCTQTFVEYDHSHDDIKFRTPANKRVDSHKISTTETIISTSKEISSDIHKRQPKEKSPERDFHKKVIHKEQSTYLEKESPSQKPKESPHKVASPKKNSIPSTTEEIPSRATTKFGVVLRRTDSGRVITSTVTERRSSSTEPHSQPCIEDIEDLVLLEQMLERVVGYEQRRRIRAQIRIVKKLIEEGKIKSQITSTTTTKIFNDKYSTKRTSPAREPKELTKPGSDKKQIYSPTHTNKTRHSPSKEIEPETHSYRRPKTPSDITASYMRSTISSSVKHPTNTDVNIVDENIDTHKIDHSSYDQRIQKTVITTEERSNERKTKSVLDRSQSPKKYRSPSPISSNSRTPSPSHRPRDSKPSDYQQPTASWVQKTSTIITKSELKKTPPKQKIVTEEKPEWITQNILKKPETKSPIQRNLLGTKTLDDLKAKKEITKKVVSTVKETKPTDCITSSYGIGPMDENGRPLFGIKALKHQSSFNDKVEVKGTVIKSSYYSENGREPVGEITVTKYSTDPNDLGDYTDNSGKRLKGISSVTTTKRVGSGTPKQSNVKAITSSISKETGKDVNSVKSSIISKVTRRGSVKELTNKFIENSAETIKTERQSSSYPKAGLILRTSSFKDTQAGSESLSSRASTPGAAEVSKTISLESMDSCSEPHSGRRPGNAKTFLNTQTKVTGVQDILSRMRNSNQDTQVGESAEDTEARSLLNKFLGAQVLMTGIEPLIESGSSSRQVQTRTTVSSSQQEPGNRAATFINQFTRPVTLLDIEDIWDEEILKLLLETSTSYEERRIIRARLRQVMAEQEACANIVASAVAEQKEYKSDGGETEKGGGDRRSVQERVETSQKTFKDGNTTTTQVTTTRVTSQRSSSGSKTMSPFAKFRQLDKQNSLQSSTPSSPMTPGGGSQPLFKFTDPALSRSASSVKDRLLYWCQVKTKEYKNIQIENFSTSWANGLAFCALIHHFLPDAFDYDALSPQQRRHNFTLAFRVADEKADIAPLLDVEDMVMMRKPDWKCVFTYVQSIYRRFKDDEI